MRTRSTRRRLSILTAALVLLHVCGACAATGPREEEERLPPAAESSKPAPDPSDPTRIEARGGAGLKVSDFTGGASLYEVRSKLALTIGKSGTFVADIGVGRIQDEPSGDDESGLTDGRFRYFHLWSMDLEATGYRGWGTSAEIRTQGTVPGTDGSNLLALGGLWSLAFTDHLSVFPNVIGSAVWSKNLDDFLGISARADLIVTWKPPWFWKGAYLKLRPSYSYGLSDDLAGEDDFEVEAAIGGAITSDLRWWWDVQGRYFFEDGLKEEQAGGESGMVTEWSLFASLTYFF